MSFHKFSSRDLGWSKRGFEMEAKLGNNLPGSFPTIGRFTEDGVATSIKSVDLTAKTYQNTGALTSRLERYVDKVADFKGATWDRRTIRGADVTSRVLHVAVQPGVATPAQSAVFDQVRAYAETRGVKLVISEVP